MNEAWDDLAPPELPSYLVAGDPTCHGGVLGWTLRQALDELLREGLQQDPLVNVGERDGDGDGDGDGGAPDAALRGERADRDGAQVDDVHDSSIVDGGPRGDSDDGGGSQPKDHEPDGGSHLPPQERRNAHRGRPKVRVSPEMIPPILSSLGSAVARTQQERRQRQAEWAAASAPWSSSSSSSTVVVAGMLRGRLRHYNRRGTKWRLVADGGSEVRARRTLDPGRRRKGGRRNLPSLWDDSAYDRGSASEDVLELSHPVEILAYDDK